MSRTLTIRLTEELAQWLERTARRTGIPAGRIVREQLERAKSASTGDQKGFMQLAGIVDGPANLSGRKGFSRK